MEDLALVHYGVKGMKWGVRRTAAQLGHKVKQTKYEHDRLGYRSSQKNRNDVERTAYAKARIERRRSVINSQYDKQLASAKSKYDKSAKNSNDTYKFNMEKKAASQLKSRTFDTAKKSAISREILGTTVKSLAKSTAIPLGVAFVTAAVGMPMADVAGLASVAQLGGLVSSGYRISQMGKNVDTIRREKKKDN